MFSNFLETSSKGAMLNFLMFGCFQSMFLLLIYTSKEITLYNLNSFNFFFCVCEDLFYGPDMTYFEECPLWTWKEFAFCFWNGESMMSVRWSYPMVLLGFLIFFVNFYYFLINHCKRRTDISQDGWIHPLFSRFWVTLSRVLLLDVQPFRIIISFWLIDFLKIWNVYLYSQ